MNVRLLRASNRTRHGSRIFPGLGQLQPVTMSHGRFGLEMRCEGLGRDKMPVLQSFPLPRYKAQAKAAMAELERHKANGTRTPASTAWDAYKAREATCRPMAAAGLTSYRYPSAYSGWIMIGARDHADGLSEARRSRSDATMAGLEIWNGAGWESVA